MSLYKQHIQNTKIQWATRNNILTKLVTSKWGALPGTISMTALALSYSTAEYTRLNQACRSVTGCLKPTNTLYFLSRIAPPTIRRAVCARVKRQKQSTRETHSLFGQIPANKRLRSRDNFLSSVQPAKVIRCSKWRKRLRNKPHIGIINLHEEMANYYDCPWNTWKCLNRLCTVYSCSNTQRKKWKFYTGKTTSACGRAEETTAHMLQCSQLAHSCCLDDLITLNGVGKQCVEPWKN